MKTMPVPTAEGRAACADPQHLPLVDAAFAKPGGPEAQQMKRELCRDCPVAQTCFTWAMTHPEAGIWAGTSPKLRINRGAPSESANIRGRADTPRRHRRTEPRPVKIRTTPPNAAERRLLELGVRNGDVRTWAYEQGIVRSRQGRVSLAHIEAWAAAHRGH